MDRSTTLKQQYSHAEHLFHHNRIKPAQQYCRQILNTCPCHADTLHLMGKIAAKQKAHARAAGYFLQALKHHGTNAMDYCALGKAFMALKRYVPAESALLKAMEQAPRNLEIVLSLATLMKRRRRIKAAAACYAHAITINPSLPDLYLQLGTLQNILEETRAAEFNFQVAWEMDPDNMTAKHMLAALRGHPTDAPPKQHIRDLFDRCSKGYDRHMVDAQGYRVPDLMLNLLHTTTGTPRLFENALDLGCGTGLVAQTFRNRCHRLTGMDMSPKMIDMAGRKGLYDALYVGNILELSSRFIRRPFDLFIAADVLVYIGNLAPLFHALETCIQPHALFIFSTETSAEEGYEIRHSGRYAHSQPYVKTTAHHHGFHPIALATEPIRKEKGNWITGDIWILGFHAGGVAAHA